MNIFKKLYKYFELDESKKMSPIFILLSIISVSSLLISNIVATKSIVLFNLMIKGYQLSLAASFIVFPFTYIISDIFSEVYGYAWSRKISWISFFVNLYMVLIIEIVILMPGIDVEFSSKFKDVLGSSFGILFASLSAYMCGDLFNDIVFQELKSSDKQKTNLTFAFRSILSSLCGEIVDSGVFLPLLYFFIGGYGTIIKDFTQLIVIILFQAVFKLILEIVLCPLVIYIVKKIKIYEGKYQPK